jgi:hypothetical protein
MHADTECKGESDITSLDLERRGREGGLALGGGEGCSPSVVTPKQIKLLLL